MSTHSYVLPTFSSMRFRVVGFMLRSLIQWDLSFVHGDRYGSLFIFLLVDIQLCQNRLLNMLSFFHSVFLLLCQVFLGVRIDIWVFPLVLLSVLIRIPGCFQYCCSVVDFEVRDCGASRSSFTIQDCFGYSRFSDFPYKVSIVLSSSVMNSAGILLGIALSL